MSAWRVADGHLLWSERTLPLEQLAISPDGRWLATAESTVDPEDPVAVAHPDSMPDLSTFAMWDLASHQRMYSHDVREQDGRPVKVKQMVFSPDSSLVAVPTTNPTTVQVFRVQDPDLLYRLQDVDQLRSRFGPIAVTFAPDGSALLSRTEDGSAVLLFDPKTGRPLEPAYDGTGDWGYGAMGFSGDGRLLFSRSPFGLSAYDAQNRRLLVQGLKLASDQGEGSMAVVADGHLFAATDTGVARLDIDPARWNEAACRLAARDMTEEEWTKLLPGRPYAPACGSHTA